MFCSYIGRQHVLFTEEVAKQTGHSQARRAPDFGWRPTRCPSDSDCGPGCKTKSPWRRPVGRHHSVRRQLPAGFLLCTAQCPPGPPAAAAAANRLPTRLPACSATSLLGTSVRRASPAARRRRRPRRSGQAFRDSSSRSRRWRRRWFSPSTSGSRPALPPASTPARGSDWWYRTPSRVHAIGRAALHSVWQPTIRWPNPSCGGS